MIADCWEGTRVGKKGYSLVQNESIRHRGTVLAHRAMAMVFYGDIDGLEVHHLCENKACINPWHLVPVTKLEHKASHLSEVCAHGHTGEMRRVQSGKNVGQRYCKACVRDRVRAYKRKKRELDGWDD